MGFEIKDGKEHLPDEEDIYGANEAEEQDEFNALFGMETQEDRLRRRKKLLRALAVVVIITFGVAFTLVGLRSWLGW
jgi:hypothetical protein